MSECFKLVSNIDYGSPQLLVISIGTILCANMNVLNLVSHAETLVFIHASVSGTKPILILYDLIQRVCFSLQTVG